MRGISGDLGAREIIRMLDLTPHPEGGHFRETYRAPTSDDNRANSTMIYYLLQADEVSAWHRVDADEFWLWHAGGPLSLTLSPPDGQGASAVTLGPDLRSGHRPQLVVSSQHWQTAETLGAWTLVSCIVAPGFEFSGFEMAPDDWRPTV
ncbi:cupin domain-containing protein [Hyphomonas sp. UBA4494]|jgi:hypothetical protein|uniref:cupin domain-containing protein n=1 Tax=Hyphomonas sp. UBA4494 TaxID=1946631 RepID=UPI0025C48BE9|nr:cupin domain-containing protein [Hyphomonas sp. UBA4494]